MPFIHAQLAILKLKTDSENFDLYVVCLPSVVRMNPIILGLLRSIEGDHVAILRFDLVKFNGLECVFITINH